MIHYLVIQSISLWPLGLQHARLPCPSLSFRVWSNSGPLNWWCHPIISSSVVLFSSCLQSFLVSGSFPVIHYIRLLKNIYEYFPCSSVDKEFACNRGDQGLIPELGRYPGEGNRNPLQYSSLENPMDRGAWQATVHEIIRVGHNLVTKQAPPPPKYIVEMSQAKEVVQEWEKII